MLSDPAAAAWVAAGRPDVEAPAPVPGRCGRCGTDGPTVLSSRIISEKFTGFDTWAFGSRKLCVPCAWSYSRPPTRQPAMLITTTHVTEYYDDGSALCHVLTAGSLTRAQAAVVPTGGARRGRHILPTAEWGHLATDNFVMPWDAAAVQRLNDAAWLWSLLRALQQTTTPALRPWKRLCDPAPPPALLTSRPRQQWEPILAAWSHLEPWRSTPPVWAAIRALITKLPAAPAP